jgi:hypothetical protein
MTICLGTWILYMFWPMKLYTTTYDTIFAYTKFVNILLLLIKNLNCLRCGVPVYRNVNTDRNSLWNSDRVQHISTTPTVSSNNHENSGFPLVTKNKNKIQKTCSVNAEGPSSETNRSPCSLDSQVGLCRCEAHSGFSFRCPSHMNTVHRACHLTADLYLGRYNIFLCTPRLKTIASAFWTDILLMFPHGP